MNYTDIIYAGLLLLSILMGSFLYTIKTICLRQAFCTAFGLALVIIVSGWHAIHPLVVTVVNCFLVVYCPIRYRVKVCFVFCFGYLVFFKYLKMCGTNPPPGITNSIQMILTLKMVGIAVELKILQEKQMSTTSEISSKVLGYEKAHMSLGICDVFQYAFCYVGILVGPYYRYRTYRDFLTMPYVTSVDRMAHCLSRMKVLPFYVALGLAVNHYFPAEYIGEDPFYNEHWVAYRLLYLWPVFLAFRMRMYVGFVLGECGCIAAGLGLYPTVAAAVPGAGPTNVLALLDVCSRKDTSREEFDYETVHNVDECGCETSFTVREGIRNWNTTVQYWLAVYFYKRLPFGKPLRTVLTMTLSSVWHGLQPGYFVCLVSASAFLVADHHLEMWARKFGGMRFLLCHLFLWILKTEAFTYMVAAFLLLDLPRVWRYYLHVCFAGHIYVLLVILWGQFLRDRSADPPPRKR